MLTSWKKTLCALGLSCLPLFGSAATTSTPYTLANPAHAPVILDQHYHHQHSGWMVGLHLMTMTMSGLRDGSNDVSTTAALDMSGPYAFMMAPKFMRMDMAMLHVMYMPSMNSSVMLMIPYVAKRMESVDMAGNTGSTRSEGLGDMVLSYGSWFHAGEHNHTHVQLGLGLPTGKINATDDTLMSGGTQVALPYAMQLGSGSFSLQPRADYTHQFNRRVSAGGGLNAIWYMNRNYRAYRLGNHYAADAWVGYHWIPALSNRFILTASHQDRIHGADPDLAGMATMMPTANVTSYRQDQLLGSVEIGFIGRHGRVAGHHLVADVGYPLYQRTGAVAMKSRLQANLQWTYSFM